jgi:hypothetical protein
VQVQREGRDSTDAVPPKFRNSLSPRLVWKRAHGLDRRAQRDESSGPTRREILAGVAGTGIAAAVPTALGERASARSAERTDVDILNYALTLEHLENEFDKTYLDRFSERASSARTCSTSSASGCGSRRGTTSGWCRNTNRPTSTS